MDTDSYTKLICEENYTSLYITIFRHRIWASELKLKKFYDYGFIKFLLGLGFINSKYNICVF